MMYSPLIFSLTVITTLEALRLPSLTKLSDAEKSDAPLTKLSDAEKSDSVEAGQLSEGETELGPKLPKWHGPKIVCTGFKKTGTLSMSAAFHRVGIEPVAKNEACQHPQCLDKYAATHDMGTCCNHGLVSMMKQLYPADKVKFVHLVRDPKSWNVSATHWLQGPDKGPWWQQRYSKLLGAKFGTPAFLQKFEDHTTFIKNLFKDEPDRLLILNLEKDDPVDNMKKFCNFVGADMEATPACTQPFPHLHEGKYKAPKKTSDKPAKLYGDLVSEEWLHADDDEDEFANWDEELATRDWVSWYAKHGESK